MNPSEIVDAAITSRMSARAFTPQAVEKATIEHLLQVASTTRRAFSPLIQSVKSRTWPGRE